ncbi:hypothetical protein TL16_g09456 [Triparma laevis f. inornata]|uniref:Uncharacterized protein n=1 Tax=Triparma laevis f. inornata TaxID=1714386 RepID=A0A9W7BA12_9STRA|nr:hypothetical protein TL16_g09456 [Triparma laevis f. inornata]
MKMLALMAEKEELLISFNELAGFTGLTCLTVTIFLLLLTLYCILKISTKNGSNHFVAEGFMYIFPLIYGTHVGIEGYVGWKVNLEKKQMELKGSHKVFVTMEKYFPKLHAWYLLWRRLGSLAHNGKYSIMTVISIDLLDFLIQAVGLELLRGSGVGWGMLWPYALLIALNGLVTGFAILFFQDRLKVEGVAALDVLFDIGYIYMSVEVFDGDGGFWTGFFPLIAAMVKTNDAWAKRVRRWCAVRYASLALDHDARKAREEGNFEEFLWQYYKTAMKLGEGRMPLKEEKARQSTAALSGNNNTARSIKGIFDSASEKEIKLRAPEVVKSVLTKQESKITKKQGIFSSQDKGYFHRTTKLIEQVATGRSTRDGDDSSPNSRNSSRKSSLDLNSGAPDSDRDSGDNHVNTSLRMATQLGASVPNVNTQVSTIGKIKSTMSSSMAKASNAVRRGRINSQDNMNGKRGEGRRKSLEGSIVESIAGVFNRRNSNTEIGFSKADLLENLLQGTFTKLYTQLSVETVSSSSGVLTFYIQHSPESFISFAKEQGFGYEQETLKVHTKNLRTIHTVAHDKKSDFVLDQVVKKIDGQSVFVGVKSSKSELKPHIKEVKRNQVFLEGFFVESLNPQHYTSTNRDGSGSLSPREGVISPSGGGTLRGMAAMKGLQGLSTFRRTKDKGANDVTTQAKKHAELTQGWPDHLEFGDKMNGGCKVTYLSCRGGVGETNTALKQRLEKLVCNMNSFYVRLSLARVELDLEGELALSKATYFTRLSRIQIRKIVTEGRRIKAALASKRGDTVPEFKDSAPNESFIKKEELTDLPQLEALVAKFHGEKKAKKEHRVRLRGDEDIEEGKGDIDESDDSYCSSDEEYLLSERDSVQLSLFKTSEEINRDLRPSLRKKAASFFVSRKSLKGAGSFNMGGMAKQVSTRALGGLGGSARGKSSRFLRGTGSEKDEDSSEQSWGGGLGSGKSSPMFGNISTGGKDEDSGQQEMTPHGSIGPSERGIEPARSFRATPPLRIFSAMRGNSPKKPSTNTTSFEDQGAENRQSSVDFESGLISAQPSGPLSEATASDRNSITPHILSDALSLIEPSHFKSITYLDREVDKKWNDISKVFGVLFLLIAAFLIGWVIVESDPMKEQKEG